MAREDTFGIIEFLDGIAKDCDEAAIESYKKVIDREAKKFYNQISHSRSHSLNEKLRDFKDSKIDYTSSKTGKMTYGYKFDWSKEVVNPRQKNPITWHDLAYIFNYGNHAFVLGDSFISNAQHRLKGLDKKAYSEYKYRLRNLRKNRR